MVRAAQLPGCGGGALRRGASSFLVPAFDFNRHEAALFGERGNGVVALVGVGLKIVAQVSGSRHAHCAGAAVDQMTLRRGGVGRRKVSDSLRDDPLRQVIDPRKAAAPRCGGDEGGPEQPFEGMFGMAPVPPAAPALAVLEGGGGERAIDPRSRIALASARRSVAKRRRPT